MPGRQTFNTSRGLSRLQPMLPSFQPKVERAHYPLPVHSFGQSPINPRQRSLIRRLVQSLRYGAHEYMTRLKNRLLMHSLRSLGATQGLSRASPCQYCFRCNRGNYSQETTTVVPSLRKKHARRYANSLSVPIVMNTCFKTDCFPRWIQ